MSEPIVTRRCACLTPVPVRTSESVTSCRKCDGWFAIEIGTPDELEALRQQFAGADRQ